MSKQNRKKHLKVIDLLAQSNNVIEKLAADNRIEECLSLLIECQENAVALGGHIEKLYGLETKTVGIIEKYCEMLYQFSEAIHEQNGLIECYNVLVTATNAIATTYSEEFPDKTEIVFFPYNATMWDSLESIWEAAKEDANCEVYVVPIPYYDKTPNGEFDKFYYDGDKFPDYVPIISYDEYDIELRRPDVIYIHNPYDDGNMVTSVDPRFYSRELTKYTNMLVYIPYFIIDDKRCINKIEHFACLPGVLQSDRVVVQSEIVEKKYIDTLSTRLNVVDKRVWKQKIMGLGSPKFDAIMRFEKEKPVIAKEWAEIIGNKKVVLYNTHLSCLMVGRHKHFLKKLEQVIELFKSRNDVVLLWRPHPLSVSTAQAMNPSAVEGYLEIVNKFQNDRVGIYDDTPSMNCAIAISDAYYGQDSSMLPLYKETGKPVMIHDIFSETMHKATLANDKGFINEFHTSILDEAEWGVEALYSYCDLVSKNKRAESVESTSNIGKKIHQRIINSEE